MRRVPLPRAALCLAQVRRRHPLGYAVAHTHRPLTICAGLTLPPETVPARTIGFGRSDQEAQCQGSATAQNSIVTKLRQAEVELGRGLRAPQVCKKLGISEQTYYRWRKEYGGFGLDQAKRVKALEQENLRLKKLVADQALDNAILKEVASGNF